MTSPGARSRMSPLGRGALTLALATLLLGTGTSAAHAIDDDPDAGGATGGAMVIAVVIPARSGAPRPSPTPAGTHVAGAGTLPATGTDPQQLVPWLLGGIAAAGAGTAMATRRRRA